MLILQGGQVTTGRVCHQGGYPVKLTDQLAGAVLQTPLSLINRLSIVILFLHIFTTPSIPNRMS